MVPVKPLSFWEHPLLRQERCDVEPEEDKGKIRSTIGAEGGMKRLLR